MKDFIGQKIQKSCKNQKKNILIFTVLFLWNFSQSLFDVFIQCLYSTEGFMFKK